MRPIYSPRIWMGLHFRYTPRFSLEELTMTESEVQHMSNVSLFSRHVHNYKVLMYYYVCEPVASVYAVIETHQQIFR
jgi:hypothetical protein